jgi:hypothetical protein
MTLSEGDRGIIGGKNHFLRLFHSGNSIFAWNKSISEPMSSCVTRILPVVGLTVSVGRLNLPCSSLSYAITNKLYLYDI